MKRTGVVWLAALAAFSTISTGLGASGKDTVPNRVLVLDQQGIHPDTITRPQGGFVLLILNRLVNRAETFALASTRGSEGAASAAAPMTTDAEHDYTYQYLDLAPGGYQLNLKNHPQLSVSITITP
jgi:hypothetical protein